MPRDMNKKREARKRYRLKHRDKWLAEKKRYRLKHRDKFLAWKKRYYQRHKEEFNKKYEEYRQANREKFLAKEKIYRQTHPESIREKRKKWKKTPRGKISKRLDKHRRREKERALDHSFSKSEWLAKIKATNGICPICKKPFDDKLHKLTLDHNPPISKAPEGFVYSLDDVEPICAMCNSKKGNREHLWEAEVIVKNGNWDEAMALLKKQNEEKRKKFFGEKL